MDRQRDSPSFARIDGQGARSRCCDFRAPHVRCDRLPPSRPARRPRHGAHAGRRRHRPRRSPATAGWSTTRPSAGSRSCAGRRAARRPVDADTGDQGGTTEGVFVSEWQGDILYGRNEAVGGHYILAYARPPEAARTDHAARARAHAALARQLPPRRRPAVLPARPRAVLRAAGPARRRRDARALRLLPLRRQPGPLHPSGHLARGRVRPAPARSASSTSRGRCMPASRSTSRASSAACSKRRSSADRLHPNEEPP